MSSIIHRPLSWHDRGPNCYFAGMFVARSEIRQTPEVPTMRSIIFLIALSLFGLAHADIVRYADGGIYDGDMVNGKRQGLGTYYYPNGARYDGQWFAGEKHGSGILHWPSGNTYRGEWRYGVRQGSGTLAWADGGYTNGFWWNDRLVESNR